MGWHFASFSLYLGTYPIKYLLIFECKRLTNEQRITCIIRCPWITSWLFRGWSRGSDHSHTRTRWSTAVSTLLKRYSKTEWQGKLTFFFFPKCSFYKTVLKWKKQCDKTDIPPKYSLQTFLPESFPDSFINLVCIAAISSPSLLHLCYRKRNGYNSAIQHNKKHCWTMHSRSLYKKHNTTHLHT